MDINYVDIFRVKGKDGFGVKVNDYPELLCQIPDVSYFDSAHDMLAHVVGLFDEKEKARKEE